MGLRYVTCWNAAAIPACASRRLELQYEEPCSPATNSHSLLGCSGDRCCSRQVSHRHACQRLSTIRQGTVHKRCNSSFTQVSAPCRDTQFPGRWCLQPSLVVHRSSTSESVRRIVKLLLGFDQHASTAIAELSSRGPSPPIIRHSSAATDGQSRYGLSRRLTNCRHTLI